MTTTRISAVGVALLVTFACSALVMAESVDVLIKGVDDGVKVSKQHDYQEAVMNAKLQAIERAGVEIESITRVVNFQVKFDMVETKAKAVLLPGFQIMDMGYQPDGTYQVVLAGKVQVGEKGFENSSVSAISEKLIPLLADDSQESTKKIELTLQLFPPGFDYGSNELIRRSRVRVLGEKINKLYIPNLRGLPERISCFSSVNRGGKPSMFANLVFSNGSESYEEDFPLGATYKAGDESDKANSVAILERWWQDKREAIRGKYREVYVKEHDSFLRQIKPYRKDIDELRTLDKDNRYRNLLMRIERTIAGYE